MTVWTYSAKADLLAIIDDLSDKSPNTAREFVADLERKAKWLQSFPKWGRLGRVPNTRELDLFGGYVVVFQERKSLAVWILRVLPFTCAFRPNDLTVAAMEDARAGRGTLVASVQDLFFELDKE